MKKLLTFIIFALIAAASRADNLSISSGNDLLHDCTISIQIADTSYSDFYTIKSSDFISGTHCLGFIEGIMNSNAVIGSSILKDNKLSSSSLSVLFFCNPSNVTASQAVRIVTKYMQDNPDQLNKYAVILVIDAMRKAYPCNLPN